MAASVMDQVLGTSANFMPCGGLEHSAALSLGRFVRSMLYGVVPNDAAAIAVAVLALGLTGLAASFVPARRATRIDPNRTLRFE